MKIPLIVVVALFAVSASAATQVVRVNADGSFLPAIVTIASGDTVEWQFSSASDSIIPSTGTCAGIKPYAPGDPNDMTGPMPQAVSGIFTLSPLSAGYVTEPAKSACTSGAPPRATAGGEMLCRGGAGTVQATMDSTWQTPSLTGVFIRLLWSEIHLAPGTADSSFDFRNLDREVDKAVKNGKMYSLAIKAGDDGTPSWLFTNGVTALQLQDSGSDGDDPGCGSRMTLGNPTQATYQSHYFDMLRKVASHLKSRADWYRALAYIKPSGANLFTHENRLPKRCEAGCVCNPQVFAQNGYTPSGLYAFYQAQTDVLAAEFPDKTMVYALIQDGFPKINNSGGYERSDGSSSNGAPLPGGTEQTQQILDNGQATHGLRFAVAHNGLSPKRADNCLNAVNAPGCPNPWVLREGLQGQVTGWQTNNEEKVANPADVDSTLQNALSNSQGIYVELYEERFWEAVRQPNGIIDPNGSGRTMTQWGNELHNRRRTLFPSIPDPFPLTHRKTFTRTASGTALQTLHYVHGAKCGTGTIQILPSETAPGAAKRRAVRP